MLRINLRHTFVILMSEMVERMIVAYLLHRIIDSKLYMDGKLSVWTLTCAFHQLHVTESY